MSEDRRKVRRKEGRGRERERLRGIEIEDIGKDKRQWRSMEV